MGGGSRRAIVLFVLVAVLAILPAAASAQTASYRYTPFTAKGKVKGALKVNRQKGRCFTASYHAPRIDTWRCLGTKFLLDPCFKKPGSRRTLVCLDTPWRRTAVLLKVKKKLKSHGAGKAHPWAVVAEGFRCDFVGGAAASNQYGRLNYSCPGRVFLFGFPFGTPNSFIWGATDPGAEARQYAVSEIWY